jgi:HPt (histidine-containing phosphotransfer) domain-containing protein
MMQQSLRREHEPYPNNSVFDLEHLQRYTMNNSSLLKELIGLFMEQMPTLQKQLETAQDEYSWRFASHTLKGSASAIGANAICFTATALESIGVNGNAVRKQKLLKALDERWLEFKETAARYLD